MSYFFGQLYRNSCLENRALGFPGSFDLKISVESMFPPLWVGSSRGTGWCSDSGTSEGEARDGLGMDFLGAVFVWVFPKIGVPQNGWLIRENPIRLDDLGVHYFWKHPYWYQVLSFFFQFSSYPILTGGATLSPTGLGPGWLVF